MTDTNSTTLRNVLSAAIKSHISESGLSMKDAAALAGVHLSRLYQVTRGDVSKVSSDALANILEGLGYKIVPDGFDFTLVRQESAAVLPEIEKPVAIIEPDQNNADFDPDFDRVSTDE